MFPATRHPLTIRASSLQFRRTRLARFLISPPSFSFRSLRCRCRARPRTHVRRTHAEERKRSHLPLPAVSLFSANVAKCLHFCITATIKPQPSLLSLSLSPSWTSCSTALCSFLPSSVYLYETGLHVEEKNFTSLLSCAIPSLPSSFSSPALPYFYHYASPLLCSSFIPLFYVHPPRSPLLPPVLCFSDFIFIQNFFVFFLLCPLAILFFLLL